MKNYYFMLILLLGYSTNAQVGINTNDPQATLHVERRTDQTKPDGIIPPRLTGDELRAKSAVYGAPQNGAIVYVTESVTATNDPKTAAVLTKGLFVYDAFASNGSGTGLWNVMQQGPATPAAGTTGDGAYSGRVRGTLSLLNLGISLLGSSIQNIALPSTTTLPDINVDITSGQITTTGVDSYYTIPSTGIYQINYSYRTGQGLRLELLGANRPGIIVTKTASGAAATTATTVDYRYFGGISLGNITVPIPPLNPSISLGNLALTQGQISHIHQFTAGDRVRFGVVTGGLVAGVLTDASAEISIYKIK